MEAPKNKQVLRKGIAQYFWEFFILLLAVVLGFFIENQRKIYVDGKNEKAWAGSTIERLRSDISEMEMNIRLRTSRYSQLDSIIIILGEKKIFGHENDLYFLGKMATRGMMSYNLDAGMDDEGGLVKALSNQQVADTIRNYKKALSILAQEQIREAERPKLLLPLLAKIFDPYVFEKMETADGNIIRPGKNLFLKNADSELLDELAFYIQDYKSSIRNRIGQLRKLQVRAKRVISYLEAEYKL